MAILAQVMTDQRHRDFTRWHDEEYMELFSQRIYKPYMQGAGYVLSHDLVRPSRCHPPNWAMRLGTKSSSLQQALLCTNALAAQALNSRGFKLE